MKNKLLRSIFKKQLIYAKQLITISFQKNNLVMQNSLLRPLFQKQLICGKQLILFFKQLIQNSLFMQNNLFKTTYLC